jgi:hypothetical protein
MKKKNPKNTVGISFGTQIKLLELGKKRMSELGIESFSEYVKQLIRYDLGLPNYIGQYIGTTTTKSDAEALDAALVAKTQRQRQKDVGA